MTERVDVDKSWKLLRDDIDVAMEGHEGPMETAVTGMVFYRYTKQYPSHTSFLRPRVVVVPQGKKYLRVGDKEYMYGSRLCLVTGIDMPVVSCVAEATEDKPYLAMSLDIDAVLIADLSAKTSSVGGGLRSVCGAQVTEISPELLDAFVRLVELTRTPDELPVMSPILVREVHYRLLKSPFGQLLRSLSAFGSPGSQIAQAVGWLRKNFRNPVTIEELSLLCHMAPSTFHRYFKEVTTLSPLQYQKRLRLEEARRLLLNGSSVTESAYAVGYESVTQFSREYKRLFGDSPKNSVLRLNGMVRGKQEKSKN